MTIVSFDRKFIFVHVPKCGGSSIESEWRRHMRPNDIVTGYSGEAPSREERRIRIAKHQSLSHLTQTLGGNVIGSWLSCVLVRNPLSVVESYYRYGTYLLSGEWSSKPWSADDIRAMVRAKDTENVPGWMFDLTRGATAEAIVAQSFGDFLERVADDRWTRYFRNYTSLGSEEVAIKQVLRLEEPVAIRKFFKTKVSASFKLLHENKGDDARAVWPPSLRERFLVLTADEHRIFGYPM